MTTYAERPLADAESVQYTPKQIIAVWAAAAGPMGVLSWLVTPLLARALDGPAAFPKALLACMTSGLVWQAVLVLVLVRRERGTLAWPAVKAALWLRAPRSPREGQIGGRLWWVLLPALVVFALEEVLPGLPAVADRDLTAFLGSGDGQRFLSGNWAWFVVIVALAVFNTVLGEELLFRGLLLPRMRGAFGRADWLANGVLFAVYHLHMPWVIPTVLLDSVALSYPSRRYRSAVLGIIVHSAQSVVIVVATLMLVIR